MQAFATLLFFVVALLASGFAVRGRANRKQLQGLDAALVAAYPAWVGWFAAFGYCLISAMPLLLAGALAEGDPLADRLVFVVLHAGFLLLMLCAFNRRVVIGKESIAVSTTWGAVWVVDSSVLRAARVKRIPVLLRRPCS